MQDLINELVEKAGLSPEAAEKATVVMVNFMKSKLPAGFSDKVEGLLAGDFDLGSMFGGGSSSSTAGDNPLDKLKGLFGK
jgi:hypothetical protein